MTVLCRARGFVVSNVARSPSTVLRTVPLPCNCRGGLTAPQVGEEVADAAGIDADVADPDAADRAHVDDRAAALAGRPGPHDDIVLEPEEEAGVDSLEDAVGRVGG